MPNAGDRIRAADITRFHASYRKEEGVGQDIPDATNTRIFFGTTEQSTSEVTRSEEGDGHVFTLNRTGIWLIEGSFRFVGGGTDDERSGTIASADSAETDRWAEGNCYTDGAAAESMMTCRLFSAGDEVAFWVFQRSGGDLALDSLGGSNRITFTWMGEAD